MRAGGGTPISTPTTTPATAGTAAQLAASSAPINPMRLSGENSLLDVCFIIILR